LPACCLLLGWPAHTPSRTPPSHPAAPHPLDSHYARIHASTHPRTIRANPCCVRCNALRCLCAGRAHRSPTLPPPFSFVLSFLNSRPPTSHALFPFNLQPHDTDTLSVAVFCDRRSLSPQRPPGYLLRSRSQTSAASTRFSNQGRRPTDSCRPRYVRTSVPPPYNGILPRWAAYCCFCCPAEPRRRKCHGDGSSRAEGMDG